MAVDNYSQDGYIGRKRGVIDVLIAIWNIYGSGVAGGVAEGAQAPIHPLQCDSMFNKHDSLVDKLTFVTMNFALTAAFSMNAMLPPDGSLSEVTL